MQLTPFDSQLDRYLPVKVNSGPWINAFTLNRLRELPQDVQFVLPVCSVASDYSTLSAGSELLLPTAVP